MEKNKNIQHRSSKKRKKPKIRFNFWVMFIIFILSFVACFILYMLAVNLNDDFFKDEFDNTIVDTQDVVENIPQTTNSDSTSSDSNENNVFFSHKSCTTVSCCWVMPRATAFTFSEIKEQKAKLQD